MLPFHHLLLFTLNFPQLLFFYFFCFSRRLFFTFTSPAASLCATHNDGQLHAAMTTVSQDVLVARPGLLFPRRLPDFYEYMYTAQSGGGFVFISPGDTSAVAPLHLFHLRRLRLALQVRSHHASMLPRHLSGAERAQALPLLHPSFSAGSFHQFLCFCIFLLPPRFLPPPLLHSPSHSSPSNARRREERTGVNTAPGTARSLTLVSEQVRFWTGGARQVLDGASRLTSVTVKVSCVSPSAMTC